VFAIAVAIKDSVENQTCWLGGFGKRGIGWAFGGWWAGVWFMKVSMDWTDYLELLVKDL
jgi:hypothetical protein